MAYSCCKSNDALIVFYKTNNNNIEYTNICLINKRNDGTFKIYSNSLYFDNNDYHDIYNSCLIEGLIEFVIGKINYFLGKSLNKIHYCYDKQKNIFNVMNISLYESQLKYDEMINILPDLICDDMGVVDVNGENFSMFFENFKYTPDLYYFMRYEFNMFYSDIIYFPLNIKSIEINLCVENGNVRCYINDQQFRISCFFSKITTINKHLFSKIKKITLCDEICLECCIVVDFIKFLTNLEEPVQINKLQPEILEKIKEVEEL